VRELLKKGPLRGTKNRGRRCLKTPRVPFVVLGAKETILEQKNMVSGAIVTAPHHPPRENVPLVLPVRRVDLTLFIDHPSKAPDKEPGTMAADDPEAGPILQWVRKDLVCAPCPCGDWGWEVQRFF